jgi:hypothetical protein
MGGAYAGLNWVVNPPAQRANVKSTGLSQPNPQLTRKSDVAVPGTPKIQPLTKEKLEVPAALALAEAEADGRTEPVSKPVEQIGASFQPLTKPTDVPATKPTDVRAFKSNAAMDMPKPLQKLHTQTQSHRKPVMMVLRTIEFPDSRREKRLLSMSEARASAY